MNTIPDELTPQEVFMQKDAEEETNKRKLIAKGLLASSCAIVILMGIIFLLSLLYSEDGSFTVRIGNLERLEKSGLSLSETIGFANPTVKLSGIPLNQMDNITYAWLDVEELDKQSGSHNGENYIAYTFYLRNSGEDAKDYSMSMNVLKVTKNVDKAVRIMVYRDGIPTIYAMPDEYGETESYPENTVNFLSSDIVFTDNDLHLEGGETHRYTIVIWLEGEDPQCKDDILKGIMKLDICIEQVEKQKIVLN